MSKCSLHMKLEFQRMRRKTKSQRKIHEEIIVENFPNGHKETLRGDGNVLCFDCGGSSMCAYLYQQSSNCTI